MWIVQCRDLEEGMGARWFDLNHGAAFQTREDARIFVKKMRETDDEESLCQYRIVEQHAYYSQPTDILEY